MVEIKEGQHILRYKQKDNLCIKAEDLSQAYVHPMMIALATCPSERFLAKSNPLLLQP